MTLKHQKIISLLLVLAGVFGGLLALVHIINLNQPVIFLHTAFWIWVYLWIKITLLYDLHFKNLGSFKKARAHHEKIAHWLKRNLKICASTLWYRFEHLWTWHFLKNWITYLLLPGMLFWSAVALFYVNLGRLPIQQAIAVLTSAAIGIHFWALKEIYINKDENLNHKIFMALSVVKIFAAAGVFGAALSITRYFCLESYYFALAIFSLSFLLIYQSLFQQKAAGLKNVLASLLIAGLMACFAYATYTLWGYNYFTAALFLTAIYNLFWSLFHFKLAGQLTKKAFFETLIFSIIIIFILFSVTNFKARILDGCLFK